MISPQLAWENAELEFGVPFRLCCWRHLLFESQSMEREHAGTYQEASFLLAGSCSAGRCYTYGQRRKGITNLTQLWTLWVTVMSDLSRHVHWCNRDMSIMGVTNPFLIVSKSYCTRWNSCLKQLLGKDVDRQAIGSSGEPNTIILLLNGHNIHKVLMTSLYL